MNNVDHCARGIERQKKKKKKKTPEKRLNGTYYKRFGRFSLKGEALSNGPTSLPIAKQTDNPDLSPLSGSSLSPTKGDEGSGVLALRFVWLLGSLPVLSDSEEKSRKPTFVRQPDKAMTTPRQPCSSGDQLTDDIDSEWSSLKSSLADLKNVVYEEDEGQETRPENIRVATGMIPLLKAGLSPRFPVPAVRTAFDGSIEFVWINGESLVTCCVQAEVKDNEIDITKSLPNQELIYRLLPYSPGDLLQEQAVVIVLQCYLGDAYPPQHKH